MNFNYLKNWRKRAFERTEGRGKALAFMFDEPVGKNDILFDFHNHTTTSDGARDRIKFGRDAAENKLGKVAISDHDTYRAVEEVEAESQDKNAHPLGRYNKEFITGVEVSCRLNGSCIEVLVYDFDLKKAKELAEFHEFPFLDRSFRLRRIIDLIQKRIDIVNKMGLCDRPLSINDFISLEMKNDDGKEILKSFTELGLDAKNNANVIPGQFTDIREKVAYKNEIYNVNFDYFNRKLYNFIAASEKGKQFFKEYKTSAIDSINNFAEFNRFLIQRKDSPFFVDDSAYWPTVEDVCEFAKKAGGVAILAHPYGYPNVDQTPEQLMIEARNAGIDGIEFMHGFVEPDQAEKIYKFCYEYGLLISAGSDTHDYFSSQGNFTEPGKIPSQGVKSKFKNNPLEDARIGTYNVHYIGSGAWHGDKRFRVDEISGYEK